MTHETAVPIRNRGASLRWLLVFLLAMSSLLASGCTVQPGSAVGVVAGVVSAAGNTLSGLPVMAQWSTPGDSVPGRAAAVTDEMGVYRFCELPTGVPVRIVAANASNVHCLTSVRSGPRGPS